MFVDDGGSAVRLEGSEQAIFERGLAGEAVATTSFAEIERRNRSGPRSPPPVAPPLSTACSSSSEAPRGPR